MDIKEVRERLGINQERLADLLGVTTRTVQNWEAGVSNPKQHQQDKINEWLTVFRDGMVVKSEDTQSDFSRLIGIIEQQQQTIAVLSSIIERMHADIIE
jgi:transcriptional regulator with XRE-family HTH domain